MDNEDLIVARAHELYIQTAYKGNLHDCAKRAVLELITVEDIRGTFALYDITLEDYIQNIEQKVRNKINDIQSNYNE